MKKGWGRNGLTTYQRLLDVIGHSKLGAMLAYLVLLAFLLGLAMLFITAYLSERYTRIMLESNLKELEGLYTEQIAHMEKILGAQLHSREVLKATAVELESFREQSSYLMQELGEHQAENEQLRSQRLSDVIECDRRAEELDKNSRVAQQEISRLQQHISELKSHATKDSTVRSRSKTASTTSLADKPRTKQDPTLAKLREKMEARHKRKRNQRGAYDALKTLATGEAPK